MRGHAPWEKQQIPNLEMFAQLRFICFGRPRLVFLAFENSNAFNACFIISTLKYVLFRLRFQQISAKVTKLCRNHKKIGLLKLKGIVLGRRH